MANRIKSGIKKHRQSLKKRERNTHVKSTLKSSVKEYLTSLESKDANKSRELLNKTISLLDKTSSKGVIHRNKASRTISRLSKRLNSI